MERLIWHAKKYPGGSCLAKQDINDNLGIASIEDKMGEKCLR